MALPACTEKRYSRSSLRGSLRPNLNYGAAPPSLCRELLAGIVPAAMSFSGGSLTWQAPAPETLGLLSLSGSALGPASSAGSPQRFCLRSAHTPCPQSAECHQSIRPYPYP